MEMELYKSRTTPFWAVEKFLDILALGESASFPVSLEQGYAVEQVGNSFVLTHEGVVCIEWRRIDQDKVR